MACQIVGKYICSKCVELYFWHIFPNIDKWLPLRHMAESTTNRLLQNISRNLWPCLCHMDWSSFPAGALIDRGSGWLGMYFIKQHALINWVYCYKYFILKCNSWKSNFLCVNSNIHAHPTCYLYIYQTVFVWFEMYFNLYEIKPHRSYNSIRELIRF